MVRGTGRRSTDDAPSRDPVGLTFSATPELADWLRHRAASNDVSIQRQIRAELEEHRVYCTRDRANRSA